MQYAESTAYIAYVVIILFFFKRVTDTRRK